MKSGNSLGSPRGCRGPTDGFTLLEAVFIVFIVAVVAAFLFPYFVANRSHHGGARKSTCQTNMEWLGTTLAMYCGDYDSKLPSSYLYGRSRTWNRSDFIHFASDKGTLPPQDRMTSGASWPELFFTYMKNKDATWCPSDPEDHDREDAKVSYFYKAAVDRAWYGDGNVKCQKEGDFDFPADQVVFYEHNSWHWGETYKGLSDGVALNMAHLDGHVSVRWIANSGGSEVTPAPMKGEPAWFNYNEATGKSACGPYWNPHAWYDRLP